VLNFFLFLENKIFKTAKMNSKYTIYLREIVKILSKDEREKFLSQGSKGTKYKELFGIYASSKTEEELEKRLNEYENEKYSTQSRDGFNTLQAELNSHLINFLGQNFQDYDSDVRQIQNLINSVKELIKRKLYNVAYDALIKSFNNLKKLKVEQANYHLFMQYINLVIELQQKIGGDIFSNLPTDFENIEVIEWLNNIGRSAAYGMIRMPANINSIDFTQNIFFQYLEEYFIRIENYESAKNIIDKITRIDYAKLFSKETINIETKINDSLHSMKILWILEGVYCSLKLNDKTAFEVQINHLRAEMLPFRDFNFQLYAFMMQHIFDLQMKFKFDFSMPFSPNFLKEHIHELKISTSKEIEKLPLRLEINTGIVHILNGDYNRAITIFESIPILPNMNVEHKLYIKIFELISNYNLGHISYNIVKLERQIDYLNTIKITGHKYAKAFLKLATKFTTPKELTENLPGFLEKNKPKTTFEYIIELALKERFKY
jgi:hypothetical protein